MREEELQAEVKHQNEKVAELQAQLAQKEQAAEHYKAQVQTPELLCPCRSHLSQGAACECAPRLLLPQMDKAKAHYDAKKQQNQELVEKLKGLEQLEKENAELKAESDRLTRELQHAVLQAKESELRTKNLTSQVHSLEAQV